MKLTQNSVSLMALMILASSILMVQGTSKFFITIGPGIAAPAQPINLQVGDELHVFLLENAGLAGIPGTPLAFAGAEWFWKAAEENNRHPDYIVLDDNAYWNLGLNVVLREININFFDEGLTTFDFGLVQAQNFLGFAPDGITNFLFFQRLLVNVQNP